MTDYYIMVNESGKEFIDPMRVGNYSRDRELDFIESSTIFWYLMGAHGKEEYDNKEKEYHGRWNGKKILLIGKEKDQDKYDTIINDNEYTDITIEAHNEVENWKTSKYKLKNTQNNKKLDHNHLFSSFFPF